MNIVEYYERQSKIKAWFNKYYQCGKTDDGSIYKFLNTNYRDILTFEYYFNHFLEVAGKPRNTWPVSPATGQDLYKQDVSGMVETLLYSSCRDTNNRLVYTLTARGKAFQQMLDAKFTDKEKWLLTFFFIVNASFLDTPRYIMKTTDKVLNNLAKCNIKFDVIKTLIVEFIKREKDNRDAGNIFAYDIVWLISFFSDESFIKLLSTADAKNKQILFNDAIQAYKQSNKNNLLAYKYKGTNFIKTTLLDTLTILYLSICIEEAKQAEYSFREFFDYLTDCFSALHTVDKSKILGFIYPNANTFSVIYDNAISAEDDFTEKPIAPYRIIEKANDIKTVPLDKIDTTSKEGIEKLEVVREVLKRLAKEKSQYNCALADLNNCKYFTSKEENKNYLEIHHLIPREFSYEFEDTIEFVENYVPLCPHCHRMIHKAVDRERKSLINYLFNQRIAELKAHGIEINIKGLYDFYKIDS